MIYISDEEILKNFLLGLDEEQIKKIYFSDINSDLFKKIANNLKNEKNVKILQSLDYSDINNKSVIYYIYDKDNEEVTKNFLLFLGYKKIKNLNIESIVNILENTNLKEFLKNNFTTDKTNDIILQLNKRVLLYKNDDDNHTYVYNINEILSPEDIIEVIKSNDFKE